MDQLLLINAILERISLLNLFAKVAHFHLIQKSTCSSIKNLAISWPLASRLITILRHTEKQFHHLPGSYVKVNHNGMDSHLPINWKKGVLPCLVGKMEIIYGGLIIHVETPGHFYGSILIP